jgi:hypothetical protein
VISRLANKHLRKLSAQSDTKPSGLIIPRPTHLSLPNLIQVPSTIAAADSDGGPATITFERVIVMPDGHRHIEGKTPFQIEHQASHMLPSDVILTNGARDTTATREAIPLTYNDDQDE